MDDASATLQGVVERDAVTFQEAVTQRLFGYDVFISYAHKDGKAFALDLCVALRKRRCVVFFDRRAAMYGDPLGQKLQSSLKRSGALVVVATPRSLDSPHVAFEVSTFATLHRAKPRPIIAIGTTPVRKSCSWEALQDHVWIEDVDPAMPGDATVEVVASKVEQRLVSTRREIRLRNSLAVSACVFLAIAAAATWQWREAVGQRDRALALRLASRSELLRDEQADAVGTAALLAAESVLRNPGETFESGRALSRALDLLPQPARALPIPSSVRLLRFFEDGSGFAAVLDDGTLRLTDLEGRILSERPGAEDAAAILSATPQSVRTIDSRGVTTVWGDGNRAAAGPALPQGALTSLDGRHALIPDDGSGNGGRLVDLETGAPLIDGLRYDPAAIDLLLVSPEREHRFVLLAGERARTARLIDRTKMTWVDLEQGNVIDTAAFSPSGRRVALGGHNFEASVFDTSRGEPALARIRHQRFIRSLAFSSDEQRLLTSSSDHTSRVIAADTGTEELRIPHGDEIEAAAFDARGEHVATASGSTIRIFTTRAGRRLGIDLHDASSLASTPSSDPGGARVPLLVFLAAIGGDRVFVADKRASEITSFDVATARPLDHWPIATQPSVLAADAAGTSVVVVGDDGKAWTNVGTTMELVADFSSLGEITTAAIDPKWLVAGGSAGATAVSRTAPQNRCDRTETPSIRAVALASAADLGILGGDRSVEVVHLPTCRTRASLPQPEAILAIAATPDGRRIAVGMADTPLVRVYDAEYHEIYAVPRQGAIRAMAFSRDGSRLAVGAEDRTTRVYDLRDSQELSRTSFSYSPWSVGFSSDGSSVRSLTGETDVSGSTTMIVAERTLDASAMLADACERLGHAALTESDWKLYLPGVRYRRTCDGLGR